MSRTSTPSPRWLVAAAVPVGIVASGLLVWQSSYAAFTATTQNPNNTFASGTVVLSDNDAGIKLFNVSGLVPGSTGFNCIDVTYTGSSAANVKFYATVVGTDDQLAPYLNFTVAEVDASATCAATGNFVTALFGNPGTLAGLVTAHNNYGSGAGAWAATGTASETKRYRFNYALQDVNAAQGKSAAVNLTWEANSVTP